MLSAKEARGISLNSKDNVLNKVSEAILEASKKGEFEVLVDFDGNKALYNLLVSEGYTVESRKVVSGTGRFDKQYLYIGWL